MMIDLAPSDILNFSMPKRSLVSNAPIIVAVLLLALAISAAVSSGPGARVPGAAINPHSQAVTPAPAETEISQAGSTDRIMWMGLVIAAIILLPILITGSTWR